jgi:Fe2+ transport system protein B
MGYVYITKEQRK